MGDLAAAFAERAARIRHLEGVIERRDELRKEREVVQAELEPILRGIDDLLQMELKPYADKSGPMLRYLWARLRGLPNSTEVQREMRELDAQAAPLLRRRAALDTMVADAANGDREIAELTSAIEHDLRNFDPAVGAEFARVSEQLDYVNGILDSATDLLETIEARVRQLASLPPTQPRRWLAMELADLLETITPSPKLRREMRMAASFGDRNRAIANALAELIDDTHVLLGLADIELEGSRGDHGPVPEFSADVKFGRYFEQALDCLTGWVPRLVERAALLVTRAEDAREAAPHLDAERWELLSPWSEEAS